MADAQNGNSKKTPEPRDAATVILMKELPGRPYEIFLMRRNANQSFMGGAVVFPGGKVDDRDADSGLANFARGLSAEGAAGKLHEPDLPGAQAIGLFFAAIRETFEETGVLLATRAGGAPFNSSDPLTVARFEAYREKIHRSEMSLGEMAGKENLCFPLDRLAPYAHWITPRIESRRFDTRFFLARIPEGQTAVHDTVELTDSVWISPAEALEKQRQGEMLLMPPTLKIMEELSAFDTLDELFDAAARRRIHTVLPQVRTHEDTVTILLPHDPEYGIEDRRQSPKPGESSRVTMRDGRWRTEIGFYG
jgi:8-oxo-dGTP pyrophosphatase MutT (NUDIX family)